MTLVPRAYRNELTPYYPIRILHLFLLICVIVIIFGGFFSIVALYKSHSFSPLSRTIARVIPLPVARIDYTPVWYYEAADFAAVFDVYGNNDQVLDDPFISGLNRAIDFKMLDVFARERGITVSQKEINAYPVEEADLEIFLAETHWNRRMYNRYVIRPLLISQKLETVILASIEDQYAVEAEMESILARINLGVAFGDLATQYSDDPSSNYAGILGFMDKSSFEGTLQPIFHVDIGEISPILEAEQYFIIAKVLDEIVLNGERTQISIQILTKNKNGLLHVFEEYKESKTVRNFIQ